MYDYSIGIFAFARRHPRLDSQRTFTLELGDVLEAAANDAADSVLALLIGGWCPGAESVLCSLHTAHSIPSPSESRRKICDRVREQDLGRVESQVQVEGVRLSAVYSRRRARARVTEAEFNPPTGSSSTDLISPTVLQTPSPSSTSPLRHPATAHPSLRKVKVLIILVVGSVGLSGPALSFLSSFLAESRSSPSTQQLGRYPSSTSSIRRLAHVPSHHFPAGAKPP
ncbi:hypothetical protein THAOC_24996 [Thalassiosira oceanica]|uniref:Uncharacterized protein n=1 Tax=Thalassiosira oceanica TaxID=159749 RepID=K0RQE4_THAOC|nr:hypothetical protein THAOC_24996 [Thalassiosira oceanica]|eukprot:EJK55285.1 hypothetical protein THAOC_24996 [Thalassiosira oceanica]